MLVQTNDYVIEIPTASVGVYKGKVPTKQTLQAILNRQEVDYKNLYKAIIMFKEIGVKKTIMSRFKNYSYYNHPDSSTRRDEYQYLIWLIAPEICPIEYLLEISFDKLPYVWAAKAINLIDKYNLGIEEKINLLKLVRDLRITPHGGIADDISIVAANKRARNEFLRKFSLFDAFDPNVEAMSRRLHANLVDAVFAPKFASKNTRRINLIGLPARDVALEKFHAATFNIFRYFAHWDKACIAGGLISKILTNDASTDTSDIDIFVLGETAEDRINNFVTIVSALESRINWLYPNNIIYTNPRGGVMSIYVSNTSIKIQVISGSNKTLADTITRFDFSVICAGMIEDKFYITSDFLASMMSGVATAVNQHRITTQRVIKLLWRGWGIKVTPEIQMQVSINQLVDELESKHDTQLIAELDACVTLTANDAFNILILSKLCDNTTISTDTDASLSMIEFNSNFESYMHATFNWRKYFKAMERRVIPPPRNNLDITIPVVNGGRTLILSVENLVVYEAPIVITREQYSYRFEVNAPAEFIRFCSELENRDYHRWGNGILSISCLDKNHVIFYVIRGHENKRKLFRSELGEEINIKNITAGTKFASLAFKITMRYRYYPGVYLECTNAIVSRGFKYKPIKANQAEECPVDYA